MPECVGNYTIPTANGNLEGADMLTGAGILNSPNICVQETPVVLLIVVVYVLLGISPASEVLQMPGKFPKEHRLHSKHGESLKTTC